jgi:hypothetical protein
MARRPAAAIWMRPEQLREWAGNPRVNAHVVEQLAASIQRFGFGAPILARTKGREIIAGHTRWKAARLLGLAEVPVRLLDLSEAEAHALALADNRLGELADWDEDALARELRGLSLAEIDLHGLGWAEDDLAELLASEPQLPDAERAPFDAYYTPERHALACCRWLRDVAELMPENGIVEPSVGSGAWVKACRDVWPSVSVDRYDLNHQAPGLRLDLRPSEEAEVLDWMGGPRRSGWSLAIGNPPYRIAVPFLSATLGRARASAMLLRETITGSTDRLAWWREHPPAYVVKIAERPQWEGPGARDTADFADSVLVVWIHGQEDTRFRWLSVEELAPQAA